jgi:hypothetical protein
MSTPIRLNSDEVKSWINNNIHEQEIEKQLKSRGLNSEEISNHLNEYKKTKYVGRQTTGFILLAIGGLIGFIGFLLTILNPFPSLYYFCLIGLTSIAAIIICLGLYYLLE